MPSVRFARVAALLLASVVAPSGATPALAHPLAFTEVTLTLRDDGAFEADLIYDLDALALGVPLTTDDAELGGGARAPPAG